MRKLFPGYYRPTEQEFQRLWQEGTFAFDANILLNFYRYTFKTRNDLLEVLTRLKERIWLPHQVVLEYHRNRLSVISQQLKRYDIVNNSFDEALDLIKKATETRHSYIDAPNICQIFSAAVDKARAILQAERERHPDLLSSDELLEEITTLFDGKVGNPYSEDDLEKKNKQAEHRLKQKIPPGYKDTGKTDGSGPCGDVIVWFQLIDYAKTSKKPLIFITEDAKEDWWWKHEGKIIGPRPELTGEMAREAETHFYMYRPDGFVEYAQKFLSLPARKETIQEIQEIQQQDEQDREALGQATWEELKRVKGLVDLTSEEAGQFVERQGQSRESIEKQQQRTMGSILGMGTLAEPYRTIDAMMKNMGLFVDQQRAINAMMKNMGFFINQQRAIDAMMKNMGFFINQQRAIDAMMKSTFADQRRARDAMIEFIAPFIRQGDAFAEKHLNTALSPTEQQDIEQSADSVLGNQDQSEIENSNDAPSNQEESDDVT